jgi:hypothetical protein
MAKAVPLCGSRINIVSSFEILDEYLMSPLFKIGAYGEILLITFMLYYLKYV